MSTVTAATTICFNLRRVLPGVARRGTGCSFSRCRLQQKIPCSSVPSTRRSLAVITIAGSSLKLFSWSVEAFFAAASNFSMRVEAFLSTVAALAAPIFRHIRLKLFRRRFSFLRCRLQLCGCTELVESHTQQKTQR